jgi:hypothetical protein
MGKAVVYFICSIAKLDVTSDKPGTLLTSFCRSRHNVSCPQPERVTGNHTPRHTPESKHFRHFRDHGGEATVPVAAVMLGFDQHKCGQAQAKFLRIQHGYRPSRIPSSSSRFSRFQHGVLVRLTASASACKESVQSCWSKESNLRSILSSITPSRRKFFS